MLVLVMVMLMLEVSMLVLVSESLARGGVNPRNRFFFCYLRFSALTDHFLCLSLRRQNSNQFPWLVSC